MILGPAHGVQRLMELSPVHRDFKLFLLLLGASYFVLAWTFEKHLAMRLAKIIGQLRVRVFANVKRRKRYKVIRDELWNA